MNKASRPTSSQIADLVALKLQEWHTEGKIKGAQPLLRIDNQQAASHAPFQFDAVNGLLHRNGCRSIPQRSRSALYAVWRIGNAEQQFACSRCKPVPTEDQSKDRGFASDLLYGFLSIIDQFGGVLQERGLEYRNSVEGRHLATQLEGLYRELGEREKMVIQTVLGSLDELATRIRNLDAGLNKANGHDRTPFRGANGRGNGASPHVDVEE